MPYPRPTLERLLACETMSRWTCGESVASIRFSRTVTATPLIFSESRPMFSRDMSERKSSADAIGRVPEDGESPGVGTDMSPETLPAAEEGAEDCLPVGWLPFRDGATLMVSLAWMLAPLAPNRLAYLELGWGVWCPQGPQQISNAIRLPCR